MGGREKIKCSLRSSIIFFLIHMSSSRSYSQESDPILSSPRARAMEEHIEQLESALSALALTTQARLADLEDLVTKITKQDTVKRLGDIEGKMRRAQGKIDAQDIVNERLLQQLEEQQRLLLQFQSKKVTETTDFEQDKSDDREIFQRRLDHMRRYGWDPAPHAKTKKGGEGNSLGLNLGEVTAEMKAEMAATAVELAAGPVPDAEYDYSQFAPKGT